MTNWNAHQTFEPIRTCPVCKGRFRQDEPGYCSIRCEDKDNEALRDAADVEAETLRDEPSEESWKHRAEDSREDYERRSGDEQA